MKKRVEKTEKKLKKEKRRRMKKKKRRKKWRGNVKMLDDFIINIIKIN